MRQELEPMGAPDWFSPALADLDRPLVEERQPRAHFAPGGDPARRIPLMNIPPERRSPLTGHYANWRIGANNAASGADSRIAIRGIQSGSPYRSLPRRRCFRATPALRVSVSAYC